MSACCQLMLVCAPAEISSKRLTFLGAALSLPSGAAFAGFSSCFSLVDRLVAIVPVSRWRLVSLQIRLAGFQYCRPVGFTSLFCQSIDSKQHTELSRERLSPETVTASSLCTVNNAAMAVCTHGKWSPTPLLAASAPTSCVRPSHCNAQARTKGFQCGSHLFLSAFFRCPCSQ